jgi:hypothetical protein
LKDNKGILEGHLGDITFCGEDGQVVTIDLDAEQGMAGKKESEAALSSAASLVLVRLRL